MTYDGLGTPRQLAFSNQQPSTAATPAFPVSTPTSAVPSIPNPPSTMSMPAHSVDAVAEVSGALLSSSPWSAALVRSVVVPPSRLPRLFSKSSRYLLASVESVGGAPPRGDRRRHARARFDAGKDPPTQSGATCGTDAYCFAAREQCAPPPCKRGALASSDGISSVDGGRHTSERSGAEATGAAVDTSPAYPPGA